VTTALYLAAGAFALVHGLNTGATMLATTLTVDTLRPRVALVIMTLGIVVAPIVLGTAVATTLATNLVAWDADTGAVGMLAAVTGSIVVIFALSRMGVPSSLTLALIGAMAGFGVVAAETVNWSALAVVMLMIAIAPVIGGLLSALLFRMIVPLSRTMEAGKAVRAVHAAAFSLLCMAYGANDGQKMLAVFAVAAGTVSGAVPVVWWQLAIAGALYAVGTMLGLPRMAATVGTGVLAVRPVDAAVTGVSTSAAMLVSTSVGAPVGLAQTLSGALIGSGMTQGIRRVRWRAVGKIGSAWVATLPAAFAIGALAGLVSLA
jgi:inorganic phosphate transporter, PiT family